MKATNAMRDAGQCDAEEAFEKYKLDSAWAAEPLIMMMCNAGLLPTILAVCANWAQEDALMGSEAERPIERNDELRLVMQGDEDD